MPLGHSDLLLQRKGTEKFMTAPKNAAAVVKQPKINPSPIKTSPHGTNILNKATFGRATPFRKDAHQASTPGFFTAPCRKPEASNPPVNFCNPCVKNVYPMYNLNN